jgi:hypothetical protein
MPIYAPAASVLLEVLQNWFEGQPLSPLAGRALDGKEYELPGDLAKQHNFLVVAFRREQQRVVDQWLPWLIDLEQRRSDVAVCELPVLSSVYGPARWFIDGSATSRPAPSPSSSRASPGCGG